MPNPRQANRTQWVWVDPCGCPRSVLEGTEAATTEQAWAELGLTARREIALRRDGVTVVHVPHDEYRAKYQPMMLSTYTCHHTRAA